MQLQHDVVIAIRVYFESYDQQILMLMVHDNDMLDVYSEEIVTAVMTATRYLIRIPKKDRSQPQSQSQLQLTFVNHNNT